MFVPVKLPAVICRLYVLYVLSMFCCPENVGKTGFLFFGCEQITEDSGDLRRVVLYTGVNSQEMVPFVPEICFYFFFSCLIYGTDFSVFSHLSSNGTINLQTYCTVYWLHK